MEINPTHVNDLLTEEEKEDKDYLIKITDVTITELVKEKDHVRKAYNYYNGIRDKDQFRHLEEIYGIGTPTSIEFIPLVRPHIDQLIGELLQVPFKPQVTCKDKKTLTTINHDKQVKIAAELYEMTKQHVNNVFVDQMLKNDDQSTGQVVDPFIEKKLNDLKEDLTKGFISEYEVAVQYLIEYFKQNSHLDFLNKRKELFKSLLISGECYFNITTDKKGSLPELEILHPAETFTEQNPNTPYRSKSTRAVVRRKMSRQEVLLRYGDLLEQEDVEKIEHYITSKEDGNLYYMTSNDEGIIAGVTPTVIGAQPSYPDNWYNWFYKDLITVYEVQFLAANRYEKNGKTHYRLDRYETIRIGDDIYILKGKQDDMFRSEDSPDDQTLSIGGICYADQGGQPYSLILATANLQDKYDILHFHRDNLIQLSGVKGSAIEMSVLPAWLGETPEERLQKCVSYKKAGIVPIDTAQDGATNVNTALFTPYDDTLPGEALQAIYLAIQQTEEQCSRITGVFRERLGQIEQKDAVTNVQTGIRQSAIITKQYFQIIDLITKEILINLINACRITFKEGFLGSIVLGNQLSQIFEIKPEHLSFTDYDIHIDDSGDIVRDMQKIEALSMELIKAGRTEADVIISSIGTHSMSQMKYELLAAYDKKRKELDEINKLSQQLMQAQEELKKQSQQISTLSKENDTLKQKDRELEKYKIDKNFELGVIQDKTQKEYHVNQIELDKRRVDLEQLQLIDNNKQNNEIKNA